MSAAEPARPVFDFIYRDPVRIASYYAQLFGGHLTGVELAENSKQSREGAGGFDIGYWRVGKVKADTKAAGEEGEARKETFVPHDVLATDLIAELVARRFVSADPGKAADGSVVKLTGRVAFGDAGVMRPMLAATVGVLADNLRPGLKAANPKAGDTRVKRASDGLATAIGGLPVPSVFQLTTPDGVVAVGCLKDAGLDEPISSIYYRHGDLLISNVTVVGVKETADAVGEGAEPAPFVGMTHGLATALGGMIFPAEAIRVTPLVIYREVRPLG